MASKKRFYTLQEAVSMIYAEEDSPAKIRAKVKSSLRENRQHQRQNDKNVRTKVKTVKQTQYEQRFLSRIRKRPAKYDNFLMTNSRKSNSNETATKPATFRESAQNAAAGFLAMESVDPLLPSDVVEQLVTQNDDIDSVPPMNANQNAAAGFLAMESVDSLLPSDVVEQLVTQNNDIGILMVINDIDSFGEAMVMESTQLFPELSDTNLVQLLLGNLQSLADENIVSVQLPIPTDTEELLSADVGLQPDEDANSADHITTREQDCSIIGKRKHADPGVWKRNQAKRRRNYGEEYTSRSGKSVPAVVFKDFDCSCPMKCGVKFSCDEKIKMFNLYWKSSRETKLAFLCGHVKQLPVKNRFTKNDISRRQKTRLFYMTKDDQTSVRVCKQMFCNVIQVSNGSLGRGLSRETDGTFEERRGKKEPANKTSQEGVRNVKVHIKSFPHYMSHYCRKENPDVRFLPQHLNLALMYRMYTADCINSNSKPVSEAVYRNIFHADFNLKFQQRKKDTCTKCDSYNTQLVALHQQQTSAALDKIKEIEAERDRHHLCAQTARSALQADRLMAKDRDQNSKVITFDLQSTLPTPRLSTNVIYYKRQLMVYNLGMHNCEDETGVMHMWHEGVASRGAQEIASCMQKYLRSCPSCDKTELVAWSDSCGGQNRNIKMALCFLKLVCSTDLPFTVITQKFLVSGHSFLPNDADFSDIEKRLKYHPQVFIPQEWYDIVAEARSGSKPFTVVKMATADFFSTLPLEQCVTNRKKDVANDKVNWLNAKQIQVRRANPKSIFMRYSHNSDETWKEIDLTKRGQKMDLTAVEQPPLFTAPRLINPLKKKDLISILNLIPPVHHSFYMNLQAANKVVETK